ncbi:unnamed protein product [Larinioides sclopetarius]|uniref:BTB domain-containing protein n=1 Tax=Larinioides sclopetarius TaxID=280406 RepID=A0AAV1YTD3_9ARAC
MATADVNERKCFTFIWKVENASYYSTKEKEWIASPSFVADETEGSKWKLCFCSLYSKATLKVNKFLFCLCRQRDSKGAEQIGIEWQVSLLASDGTVLSSSDRRKGDFRRGFYEYNPISTNGSEVLVGRRSEFLQHDDLMFRCKLWASDGEMMKDILCVARSRLMVEKRSFLWKVGNCSAFENGRNYTYEIKSLETEKTLITLDLFLTGEMNSEEIHLRITQKDAKISSSKLEMFAVDASGNAVECLKQRFSFSVPGESKRSPLCLSKAKLMENNKFLSLQCTCDIFSGIILKEIERVISDTHSNSFENAETKNRSSDRYDVLPSLKNVLINDFKSMLNERIQSDIQLRTSSKTYPAHKCILSARSPVFKAMFSNDMKEKINDRVEIDDLKDDTVSRMLRYIYCAEVEKLDWGSAIQLYEVSDKYEILTLRDVCSSYLKNNLCGKNACEALVLADLHQDEGLKYFVQDFIVTQGKAIVFCKEWEQLMETNPKLAAETMRLKYKE